MDFLLAPLIKIILNENTVVQPSCAGSLCDQQEILNAKDVCGYFHKTACSKAAVTNV
jgi:hypothetical protein